MKLSEFLKKKRLKKNLTQSEMADSIGITRSYYATLENGWFNKSRNSKSGLGIKTIRRIAEFTGVTTDYIRTLISNEKGE